MFKANTGMPGFKSRRTTTPKLVTVGGIKQYLPGGRIIDGTRSRDVFNPIPNDLSADRDLEPGLLMGIVTASGKFANSFFGITAANVAATATSFTVTAKQAQELVRRNGSSSGTCTLVGPPTANGTVVQEVVTFSNVNTTTGVVMCSALTNAFFAGALLGANDGSQVPVTFIPEEWGEFINEDSGDVPFPMIPLDAIVNQTQLTPYPTAVPLREWIKDFLTTKGPYRATLVFTDRF